MSNLKAAEMQQIADQIESYLNCHPNAADTLEGIIDWWLPVQDLEDGGLIVQQALDYLGSRSVIKCHSNLSGIKVYFSNIGKSGPQCN